MQKFIGKILILIGSIGLIITTLAEAIYLIIALNNQTFLPLINTSNKNGWYITLLILFILIYCFTLAIFSLKQISLGRNSKKTFYLSLLILIGFILKNAFFYYVIKDCVSDNDYNFYFSINISYLVFILIEMFGSALNYHKNN